MFKWLKKKVKSHEDRVNSKKHERAALLRNSEDGCDPLWGATKPPAKLSVNGPPGYGYGNGNEFGSESDLDYERRSNSRSRRRRRRRSRRESIESDPYNGPQLSPPKAPIKRAPSYLGRGYDTDSGSDQPQMFDHFVKRPPSPPTAFSRYPPADFSKRPPSPPTLRYPPTDYPSYPPTSEFLKRPPSPPTAFSRYPPTSEFLKRPPSPPYETYIPRTRSASSVDTCDTGIGSSRSPRLRPRRSSPSDTDDSNPPPRMPRRCSAGGIGSSRSSRLRPRRSSSADTICTYDSNPPPRMPRRYSSGSIDSYGLRTNSFERRPAALNYSLPRYPSWTSHIPMQPQGYDYGTPPYPYPYSPHLMNSGVGFDGYPRPVSSDRMSGMGPLFAHSHLPPPFHSIGGVGYQSPFTNVGQGKGLTRSGIPYPVTLPGIAMPSYGNSFDRPSLYGPRRRSSLRSRPRRRRNRGSLPPPPSIPRSYESCSSDAEPPVIKMHTKPSPKTGRPSNVLGQVLGVSPKKAPPPPPRPKRCPNSYQYSSASCSSSDAEAPKIKMAVKPSPKTGRPPNEVPERRTLQPVSLPRKEPSPSGGQRDWEALFIEFYAIHNPDNLSNIPRLISQFTEASKISQLGEVEGSRLWQKMLDKYGVTEDNWRNGPAVTHQPLVTPLNRRGYVSDTTSYSSSYSAVRPVRNRRTFSSDSSDSRPRSEKAAPLVPTTRADVLLRGPTGSFSSDSDSFKSRDSRRLHDYSIDYGAPRKDAPPVPATRASLSSDDEGRRTKRRNKRREDSGGTPTFRDPVFKGDIAFDANRGSSMSKYLAEMNDPIWDSDSSEA
eukprot:TRINITY_DN19483_c0_g3_i1.p1 TRINITY_DN19483_c0_g3~~TRINITY_DN19483_c0_g3_i1.p1  ORF type:complete len:824 (+),score=79.19 TRINITY_DN19483_c0_g3_i1:44-2515(+)